MTHESTPMSLAAGFSMEITGKDIAALEGASSDLPAGTSINITHLGNESPDVRVSAAGRARELGFLPVPHVAARRIESTRELRSYLGRLHHVGAADSVFVVGGDPSEPWGPFADALALIASGELQRHGVAEVGIAGYPEGHPDIPTDRLWASLHEKVAAIEAAGMRSSITTQFGFDTSSVLTWIGKVREQGISVPIRVGTPGPAGIKRLLTFARRFGIGANAMIVKKYGFSLANLMGTAGPDRFVTHLAQGLGDIRDAGPVGIHLYAFGGPAATAQWARDFLVAEVR